MAEPDLRSGWGADSIKEVRIMVIDVYADIVCPWCYIGMRRLERALALRPDLQVERRWRPFQLRPDMPDAGLAWAEFVRRKFGSSALAVFAQVTAVGATEGVTFAFDRVASAPNTRDAHRLILFAARHGLQWEAARALFAAYFAEGRNLNDIEHLVAIAVQAGLEAGEVRAYLQGSAGMAEVMASQDQAYRQGVSGVPHYVVDGRYAIRGAQPAEVFLHALDAVHAEHALPAGARRTGPQDTA